MPDPTEGNPLNDPRVKANEYVVYPTHWEQMGFDRDTWALTVKDGHKWGWSVRPGMGYDSTRAMNRKGEWVWESRGHKGNRFRRYSLEEALALALKHVDTLTNMGFTAEDYAQKWPRKPEADDL